MANMFMSSGFKMLSQDSIVQASEMTDRCAKIKCIMSSENQIINGIILLYCDVSYHVNNVFQHVFVS